MKALSEPYGRVPIRKSTRIPSSVCKSRNSETHQKNLIERVELHDDRSEARKERVPFLAESTPLAVLATHLEEQVFVIGGRVPVASLPSLQPMHRSRRRSVTSGLCCVYRSAFRTICRYIKRTSGLRTKVRTYQCDSVLHRFSRQISLLKGKQTARTTPRRHGVGGSPSRGSEL